MKSRSPLEQEGGYTLISSIDTYVYDKIKKTLDVILKDKYIIDTALARIDEDARENFKDTFTGEKPKRDIEMSYQFPQVKEEFVARLVVQMGSGGLAEESIGSVEGTFTYRELGSVKEQVIVKDLGQSRVGFELEHTIGDIETIEQLAFMEEDDVKVEDNILSFSKARLGELLGMSLTVHYIAKEKAPTGEDPKGVKLGFTSKETVVVTPLSTSMDVARCLDAILKVVLIIMLHSEEELNEYLLQQHSFEGMQNIIPEPLDKLIFGRPLTLTYNVSHNLDFDYLNEVKQINVKH